MSSTSIALNMGQSRFATTSGLEEIVPYLASLAEIEEDIRHHMSLYSQGFSKLGSLGLEIPDEMS